MFAIGTVILSTRNRRPWNRPLDFRSLEGDPDGDCDMKQIVGVQDSCTRPPGIRPGR